MLKGNLGGRDQGFDPQQNQHASLQPQVWGWSTWFNFHRSHFLELYELFMTLWVRIYFEIFVRYFFAPAFRLGQQHVVPSIPIFLVAKRNQKDGLHRGIENSCLVPGAFSHPKGPGNTGLASDL